MDAHRSARSILRILTPLFAAFGGGWMLLRCMGLYVDVKNQGNGYYDTSSSSHPILYLAAYLTFVIGLQFVSAWLLMPAAWQQSATAYWRRYAVTLLVLVLGCVASAALILFGLLSVCGGCV
jgi:hypothetical protein